MIKSSIMNRMFRLCTSGIREDREISYFKSFSGHMPRKRSESGSKYRKFSRGKRYTSVSGLDGIPGSISYR